MNLDQITLNEVFNDGSKIYLYQEETTAIWAAWGYSAYLLSQMPGVRHLANFSDKMQMPSVCISDADLKGIVQRHPASTKCCDSYYLLSTTMQVDDDGYQRWVESLKTMND